MKKLTLLLIMVFSLAITPQVNAQVKTISGTVTAESDGLPLPGVNVVIQGTTKGSQTRENNSKGKNREPYCTIVHTVLYIHIILQIE